MRRSRWHLSATERFWSKVDKSGECWTWTGAGHVDGYGIFWAGPSNKMAHRAAYEFEVGQISEGLEIDHLCYNRLCVRPAHLRQVTHKKNIENRNGAQSNSKSGVRGVCWDKRREQWHARVVNHRKAIHVGYFSDLEAAKAAVEAKRSEIYNTTINEKSN